MFAGYDVQIYKVTNDFKEACEDNNVMYVHRVSVRCRIAGFDNAFSEQTVDMSVEICGMCMMIRRTQRRCISRQRWSSRTRTEISRRTFRLGLWRCRRASQPRRLVIL